MKKKKNKMNAPWIKEILRGTPIFAAVMSSIPTVRMRTLVTLRWKNAAAKELFFEQLNTCDI